MLPEGGSVPWGPSTEHVWPGVRSSDVENVERELR
jgi:hypothetical protein